jgi:hypothetical protein
MNTRLLAALLITALMLGTAVAQHDHGGMVTATADTTVTLHITPDTVSGFNLHLVTTGFRFAPERIGGWRRARAPHRRRPRPRTRLRALAPPDPAPRRS